MPKVSKEYLEEKRATILSAAYEVAMSKPVYKVSMRDLILKTGYSQGGIYCYFRNIDDIYISLVNEKTELLDVDRDIAEIFEHSNVPQEMLKRFIQLWQKVIINSIVEIGKIYFEVCTMCCNDKQKLDKYLTKCKLMSERKKLHEQTIEFLKNQEEKGYFQPKQSVESIVSFIATAFDGILRDLTITKVYIKDQAIISDTGVDVDVLVSHLYNSIDHLLGNC